MSDREAGPAEAPPGEQAASKRTGEPAIEDVHGNLQSKPDDAQALNARANQLLKAGRSVEATELLRRAVAVTSTEPAIWFNLGAAASRSGLVDEAIAALNQALRLDPYFVQAMFQKAILLERRGDLRSAIAIYRDFLKAAPAAVLASERFAGPIGHARTIVQDDDDRLAARLASFGQDAPSERSRRIGSLLTGRSRVYHAEPTFLTVPQLPAIEFFDRSCCSWLTDLEAATPLIRAEATAALEADSSGASFMPYVANPPGTALEQWADLDHNPAWSAFHLWRHGAPVEENLARCPATARVLAGLPLLKIGGRAPNAFFSLLRPGTRIPSHTGVTNARATVHLSLVIPSDCGFRVGAETREWTEGQAWVFDDTIEHEAWNLGNAPRLILIIDVWNPLLDEGERKHIVRTLSAYDAHQGQTVLREAWSG